jgi:hypothetical protein
VEKSPILKKEGACSWCVLRPALAAEPGKLRLYHRALHNREVVQPTTQETRLATCLTGTRCFSLR